MPLADRGAQAGAEFENIVAEAFRKAGWRVRWHPAAGDMRARGFLIENGERAQPIDEFTIAGNLLEMLAGLDAVANDLRFDGTIVSPSFRVAEMTVSGG